MELNGGNVCFAASAAAAGRAAESDVTDYGAYMVQNGVEFVIAVLTSFYINSTGNIL